MRLALNLSKVAVGLAFVTMAGCQQSAPLSETAAAGWPGETIDGADPAMVERGREIAQNNCASCHAIDRTSRSPLAEAPPLRDVLSLYEVDNLSYRFIEGMRVGHDSMPTFDFDIRSADALIAFLSSLSAE